jgi:hypothetical protein
MALFSRSTASWLSPALLVCLWTVANALKPLHIDDSTYYAYARHIASQPLDPYGFALLYFNEPLPANRVLAPPVLPYWWAAGIRVLADEPWLWKLWFFPFAFLFVFGLWDLLQAFAPSRAGWFLWLIVLSPAVFPGFNLMTEVPSLGLGLAGLAVFRRAGDHSRGMAVLAGLLCALAVETKYTGLLTLAAIFLYGAVFGRRLLAAATGLVAAGLVVAWEAFIASKYGESHFLYHLLNQSSALAGRIELLKALPLLLGYLVPLLAPIGLIVLRFPAATAALTGLTVLGYASALCWPDGPAQIMLFFLDIQIESPQTANLLLGLVGLAVLATIGMLAAGVVRQLSAAPDDRRAGWFLLLWLLLELAGYVAFSPFPAARRVMGSVVVAGLLTARVAEVFDIDLRQERLLRCLALAQIALGCLYTVIDWREAAAEKTVVKMADDWIRARDASPRIWYVGYWGFQFYAECAGMEQVIPPYRPRAERVSLPPPSLLRPGDWIIKPGALVPQQLVPLGAGDVGILTELAVNDRLGLRTLPGYYQGKVPLRQSKGSRASVTIGQIRSRGRLRPMVSVRSSDHWVPQHADVADLCLHDVPRAKVDGRLAAVADAAGRAGRDDVAWLQRREARQDRDESSHREDHLRRGAVLHRPAVDPQLHGEVLGSAGGRSREHARAHGQKRIVPLAVQPIEEAISLARLAAGLEPKVAVGDIVGDGVAGDVVERAFLRDGLTAAADDDSQLGLPVDVIRGGGGDPHRVARIGERGGGRLPEEIREGLGALQGLSALLTDVLGVVARKQDDLIGITNGHEKLAILATKPGAVGLGK